MIEIMAAFAVFRLTKMMNEEDGPYDIFQRFRNLWYKKNGKPAGFIGEVLDCFWCLSVWVALPFAALICPPNWAFFFLYWMGLSGGAMLINSFFEEE